MTVVALLLAITPPTPPDRPLADRPLCEQASHTRLLVRPGRDACAPALDAQGRPVTVGLMPTACPAGAELKIDAIGQQDRCAPAPTRPK